MTNIPEGFGHGPSTIRLGDLEVRRLGFGAMRLPGKDVWGEPDDPARAKKVMRRAVDLGVDLIDTAWYYGPYTANRLIKEALHPYPKNVVIATKLGGKRLPDKSWAPALRPEELRKGAEDDLKTLGLERLDVVHLRTMKNDVPFLESLDALLALKKEGKIRHIALSNVTKQQVTQTLERTPVVSVQNLFHLGMKSKPLPFAAHASIDEPEAVLRLCEEKSIAYMPFFPLAVGNVAKDEGPLAAIAKRHGAPRRELGGAQDCLEQRRPRRARAGDVTLTSRGSSRDKR
jgi:pyridoxine 4-dehydrogenase